jgi:hypothetical protein
VRLHHQQRRRVPGDPAGEAVGQAEGGVERLDGDRSAPPTPAPKQASVVRSMFTQGSRRVIIALDVTACWRWPVAGWLRTAPPPEPRAAGRTDLAMVRNWSAVAV